MPHRNASVRTGEFASPFAALASDHDASLGVASSARQAPRCERTETHQYASAAERFGHSSSTYGGSDSLVSSCNWLDSLCSRH